MLFLTKKIKITDSGFFPGFTDYHNHILPGVDDGFKTLEESLKGLEYFEELGVQKIIFTPHRMNGVNTTPDQIESAYKSLLEAYQGKIQLSLSGEYMLDSGFEERMNAGLLPLEEKKVLVETSYLSAPNNFKELLFMLSVAGYTPVIAHPERYSYMGEQDYRRLKEKGYLFQLNLLSLTGYYGSQAAQKANFLLEKGLYDMAGTDIHNLKAFRSGIEKWRLPEKQLKELSKLN